MLQVQVQEQSGKSTPYKVRLTADVLASLQEIQNVIECDPMLPRPSIHALIIKAISNYIVDFQKARGGL